MVHDGGLESGSTNVLSALAVGAGKTAAESWESPIVPRNIARFQAGMEFVTPPRKPLKSSLSTTTPPAVRGTAEPSLLRAIRMGSVWSARKSLEDPDALSEAFLHELEPPLCFALRAGASTDLLRLLVQAGTDISAADVQGWTPATALSAVPLARRPELGGKMGETSARPSLSWALAAAGTLLDAGVRPSNADGSGRVPAQLARRAGNFQLETFWRHGLEARAAAVLWRAHGGHGLCSLPSSVLRLILGLLLPERIVHHVLAERSARPGPKWLGC